MKGKRMKHKILNILDHFEEPILVVSFAAMLIINFGNVCSRKIFHTSWAFTEEVCMIAFLYVTFFGASLAVRKHQHLGFSLIYERMSGTAKLVFDTFNALVVLALMYITVRYGIEVVRNQIKYNSMTAALKLPNALGSACVPIGAACVSVRTIQNYVLNIREFIAGKKAGTEELSQ